MIFGHQTVLPAFRAREQSFSVGGESALGECLGLGKGLTVNRKLASVNDNLLAGQCGHASQQHLTTLRVAIGSLVKNQLPAHRPAPLRDSRTGERHGHTEDSSIDQQAVAPSERCFRCSAANMPGAPQKQP